MPTVQVTVRQQGRQEQRMFRTPVNSSFAREQLQQLYGPGVLCLEGSNAVLAATEELQPAEAYVYQVSAGAAAAAAAPPANTAAAGVPTLYEHVTLHIAGGGNNTEELVRQYARVSRATLQKVLDRQGCDVVQDPVTKELVSFDAIELRDNMLLTALRDCVPWDARISSVEGFLESSVKAFEEDATEAVFQRFQQQHSSARVLNIRDITSADGRRREVDGAVVADGCAAIVEAKQVLDETAVPQLASCIEFIRDSELTGPAAELKGKKLLGFLAGRTLSSDPGKVQRLVRDCRQHGYGIYVSSGKSLSLGNSRVPGLGVKCAMAPRGAAARPVRIV